MKKFRNWIIRRLYKWGVKPKRLACLFRLSIQMVYLILDLKKTSNINKVFIASINGRVISNRIRRDRLRK